MRACRPAALTAHSVVSNPTEASIARGMAVGQQAAWRCTAMIQVRGRQSIRAVHACRTTAASRWRLTTSCAASRCGAAPAGAAHRAAGRRALDDELAAHKSGAKVADFAGRCAATWHVPAGPGRGAGSRHGGAQRLCDGRGGACCRARAAIRASDLKLSFRQSTHPAHKSLLTQAWCRESTSSALPSRARQLPQMAKWGEGDPRWIVEDRTDGTNVNNWHW